MRPPALTAAFVVPCLNEEEVVGDLVAELRTIAARSDLPVAISGIYVVDNGSTDATAARAALAGAIVVSEPRRGYGRACLTGALAAKDADLLIFLDGDRSDRLDDLPGLLEPIVNGRAELAIGARSLHSAESGALTAPQRFGNWLATRFLRLAYGVQLSDVGPFRVIRRDDLLALGMTEMTYGWPVEMIARAARQGLRIHEAPVGWRRRAGGESKVSGNLRASAKTGWRMCCALIRSRRAGVAGRPSE